MSEELELSFIELAVGGSGRRVQTIEGARFYGQPIGTLITPDMQKAARAAGKAKGITPPKGGLSKKPKKVSVASGKASPAGNFDANPGVDVPKGADTSSKFQVKSPTIKGPQGFKVGQTQFSAPSGSKLIRPKNQPDFAYVVTSEGSVHAFTPAGEVDVPDYLEPVLTKKFKDLNGDDTLYKVDSFDAPSSLAEQKPGSTLSKNGKALFKKQGNGVWMNEDIGAELTDEDLQRLYESGSFDLEPANTVEDIDFSKLTTDELQAALEAMPDGKQMKFSKTIVTKKNGKWNSAATGKNTSSEDLAYMAAGTGSITDKLDNPEAEPEPGKADKAVKEKEATDPLRNPENEVNEANAMKKKAQESKVSGAEILNAEVGTIVYHDMIGAFTKKDKNHWENLDGAVFKSDDLTSSANSGFISHEPWTPEQKEAKEKFDTENTLTVDGKKIATVAKFGENERSEKIKADGGSTPNVFELEATPENAKTFRDAMQKSLEGNPYAASVYVYEESDYADMRLFLSDDGKSGIALHNGDEIVSVFSDPKSKNKKVARHLISVAVENGGKRLDAFDTVLPSIYAKEGFVVKSRLKWNDDYAPDGWDKETFSKFNNGEPDVVFMQYENGMEDVDYEPGSGDYVDDYDSGLASTGGKVEEGREPRPQSGDPDNEESTVETTPGGFVLNDEVKNALADNKKITAIVGLKNSNKGMSLAEAKKEIDALVVEGYQPGDRVTGNMLWYLPEGAKIKTASGGEFTKNENGNWVTRNGGVFSSDDMYDDDLDAEIVSNPAAKQKKVAAPKVEEPEVDENAVSVEKLHSLKAGDIISNGEFEFTKNENDKFVSDDFLYDFDAEDFSQDINKGLISIVEESGSEEDEGTISTIEDLQSLKPGEQFEVNGSIYTKNENGGFESGGWSFSVYEFKYDLDEGLIKKLAPNTESPSEEDVQEKPKTKGFTNTTQVKDAITALESHSGFQIKYGLKSLPDDHPLKDQETLDAEVAKAKKEYPDLPPKKALLKSLKVSINQDEEPLADWEMELLEGSSEEKIQIGTRTPKTNATGVTGGQFNKSDVQSAIDILENYDGKLFKNELNKQGNPLGKLSPNDIVGFDKDKTVTKQKFIDLLKKKISTPEPNASGKTAFNVFSVSELQNAQVGSVIGHTVTGAQWTKNEDGTWSGINPSNFGPAISKGFIKFHSAIVQNQKTVFDNGSFDTSETPEVGKVVAADPDMDSLKNAPVGSVISRDAGADVGIVKYRKTEEGLWQNLNNPYVLPKKSDYSLFYNKAMQGKLHWDVADDRVEEPSYVPKVGDKPSYDQVKFLPVGTHLTTPGGTSWYKTGDDEWSTITSYGDPGGRYPSEHTKAFLNVGNGTIASLNADLSIFDKSKSSSPVLKDGDVIPDMDTFKNLPNGSEVVFTSKAGGIPSSYVKMGPDSWLVAGDSEFRIKDHSFASSIAKGTLTYKAPEVTPEGDPEASDTMDALLDAHFKQMAELDKAVSVLPAEERGANGDGYVIVHTENGPKITWGKFGGGGIATVAVDENGVKKVLIGKRGDRDEWYLPGGAIDENETHLQGALREFTEEVENGDAILENIQITQAFQANIGKIEGTDKDWKYVTSVATLPSMLTVTAPESLEDWELKEYKWYSAEELADLDAQGKLHPALGGGNLAKMVGFESFEGDDIHADILSLMNEPVNLNEDRYEISNWKKVGGNPGGWNPGGVYEDPLGNKYYVKDPNGGETSMHNEIIAGALYDAAGVSSNELFFVRQGDKRLLASPWVENDPTALPEALHGNNPGFLKKVWADFAVDAWLGNYDVIGNDTWNLVAGEDGNPLRIDPGGAMMYRGTGALKAWWSDNPTDIDDMRFGASHSGSYQKASIVFGEMTDDDVKESAKKLLDVTPEKIATIVHSSGLDAETANKLYDTLVIRRQKILDRFDLNTPETSIETPAEVSGTPAFAKGTTVKVKGSGQQFQVELSNNEATAGLVNGKFLVFLNDEITSDLNAEYSAQHAFTSNGVDFKKADAVEVFSPSSPGEKIQGFVMEADWSSGLVKIMTGEGSTDVKVIEVEKHHITKMAPQAPQTPQKITLPAGFAEVPEGYKPYAEYYKENKFYLLEDQDGMMHVFENNGDVSLGSSKEQYEESMAKFNTWKPWDGSISENSPSTTEVEGPKDSAGKVVAKGDKVTIVKYNKSGFSNQAKIISINEEKGTVRVRRLDEHGVAMSDANGKPMYATMSLTSIRKNNLTISDNGLPSGITMTQGDKNNPLYGASKPEAPQSPASITEDVVSPEWFAKAEEAYKEYRAKKSLTPKDLKSSSTAWAPMQQAMQGDQDSLDKIKSKGYLDSNPALYEELQKALDANKKKYASLVAQHEANVAEYQKKMSEWMSANGVASYTPVRHEDLLQMDEDTSKKWARKTFKTALSNLTSSAKQGLQTQKGSSTWQKVIRKLPAVLGLRREDVVNAPGVTASDMKTWDQIKEATDIAGGIEEGFRAVRTISFDRLVGPDGKPLSEGADLTKIIGSIQKDHGAMEIVPNSVDHNGKVVSFYPVVMDLAVPPGVKGMYTGFSDFSHSGEHGMIMEPGLAMYIWDAQMKKVPQLDSGSHWVVKASIIPRDVLPYMNNFEGDPMSHNIFIPGKDTTTGVPSVPTPAAAPVEEVSNPDARQFSANEIKNLPIGTSMVEIADDGSHLTTWTKMNEYNWKSSNGGSMLGNNDLGGFTFQIKSKPATPTTNLTGGDGIEMPLGAYTETHLSNMSLGTIVKDNDGDRWVKIEDNLWECLGPDEFYKGATRNSLEVAEYLIALPGVI